MNDDMSISFVIEPAWSTVKEAMSKAEAFLGKCGKCGDLISATVMCVSELIENAVKYGDRGPNGDKISFEMTIDEATIRVTVRHGVTNEEDVGRVIETIEELKRGSDPKQLYSKRLRELLNETRPSVSRLGLFRIAYEGEFRLDCSYTNQILAVSAERAI